MVEKAELAPGFIQFNTDGQGSLIYVDNAGQNLLGKYSSLEITMEPDPDPSPIPSNTVAFAATLPAGGLTHVRHLLYSFSSGKSDRLSIRGLDVDTQLINDFVQQMLTAYQAGDEADVRLQAEEMLNVILGSQSESYKDWNGDGEIQDPGDGFGLLLNGDNIGYIQGTFTHADLALTSPDATENMKIHGEHVKIAATNVADWTPQLRDQLIAIVQAPFDADMEGLIRQAVATGNQIRNGIDINGNENIEPIPGEGGARTAYEDSYDMADMLNSAGRKSGSLNSGVPGDFVAQIYPGDLIFLIDFPRFRMSNRAIRRQLYNRSQTLQLNRAVIAEHFGVAAIIGIGGVTAHAKSFYEENIIE